MSETSEMQVGGTYFKSSVKRAREALKARANEILERYLKMIDLAVAAEDFETANKAFMFLIEHMPKDELEAIIDESAAKPKQVEKGYGGPVINIGVKVGGSAKELPATIEVSSEGHQVLDGLVADNVKLEKP